MRDCIRSRGPRRLALTQHISKASASIGSDEAETRATDPSIKSSWIHGIPAVLAQRDVPVDYTRHRTWGSDASPQQTAQCFVKRRLHLSVFLDFLGKVEIQNVK